MHLLQTVRASSASGRGELEKWARQVAWLSAPIKLRIETINYNTHLLYKYINLPCLGAAERRMCALITHIRRIFTKAVRWAQMKSEPGRTGASEFIYRSARIAEKFPILICGPGLIRSRRGRKLQTAPREKWFSAWRASGEISAFNPRVNRALICLSEAQSASSQLYSTARKIWN